MHYIDIDDNTKKLMFGIDYINRTINFNLSSIIKSEEILNSSLFIFPTGSTLFGRVFFAAEEKCKRRKPTCFVLCLQHSRK